MKKHGNALYVMTQGAYLNRDGENLVISVDFKERLRLPIHTLDGVVAFGDVMWTPFALGLCAENGVLVSMLTQSGRFLARVSGAQTGNVLLRRRQHQATSDPEIAAEYARTFLIGKIFNARTVLQRALRDHAGKINDELVRDGVQKLAWSLDALKRTNSLDQLRGIEGDAARAYFASYDALILSQKEYFFMRGRSKRPPLDRMNALLSFLYTLLVSDLIAACESVGLDPQMGFLHADRPGRPSLALDLMEEFRPYFADRLALSLVNRNQISWKGFEVRENGAVVMDDETRKIVLTAWKERKDEIVVHPFLDEKSTLGLFPFIQAQLLARRLRDDLDSYPPVMFK